MIKIKTDADLRLRLLRDQCFTYEAAVNKAGRQGMPKAAAIKAARKAYKIASPWTQVVQGDFCSPR